MPQGFAPASEIQQHPSKRSALKPAVGIEAVQELLASHFSSLEDPRGQQGREHALSSIVLIAILATIGGARGQEDIETYGISHQQWLETFLDLGKGIPQHKTCLNLSGRFLRSLDTHKYASFDGLTNLSKFIGPPCRHL